MFELYSDAHCPGAGHARAVGATTGRSWRWWRARIVRTSRPAARSGASLEEPRHHPRTQHPPQVRRQPHPPAARPQSAATVNDVVRLESSAPALAEAAPATARVSVVIPAWNASGFIHAALASIAAQTHPVHEILVVNDGCPPDEAARLHAAVAPFAPRARCIDAPHAGPGAARNRGITEATGEYVAFLDADDCWEPTFLAHQLALFAERASLGLVYSDMVIFGDTAFGGRRVMEWSK